MTPQLCLGTAQFGLDYGITNALGQVDLQDVCEILACAQQHAVQFLDTAQSYGNAEQILGKVIGPAASFRIISKLPPQPSALWDSSSMERWERDFQQSLKNLGKTSIDALLLHRSADLLRSDSDRLLDWMQSLVERQLVQRIGVSIYEAFDLDGLPLEHLQLVQLPLSIYDQRMLLDGTVHSLRHMGLNVHARSVFLQGLVLTLASQWPNFLSEKFQMHHQQWEDSLRKAGSNSVFAALRFVRQIDELEAVLLGVENVKQMQELITSWTSTNPTTTGLRSDSWAWHNSTDLDPRTWPSKH